MNVVVFAGRLTRDPELKVFEGKDGEPSMVANFGLAVNRTYNKDVADFFECSVFGKQAESLCNYKKKGDPILMRGEAQYRTWESQDGSRRSAVSFKADTIQFLNRSNGGQQQGQGGDPGAYHPPANNDVDLNEEDYDDIPFAHFNTKGLVVRDIL